jgi:hypothetical protein
LLTRSRTPAHTVPTGGIGAGMSDLTGLTECRAILDKLIGEHRGRIANTAGDSVLAEFGSAVDAVQCAVEAQAALA